VENEPSSARHASDVHNLEFMAIPFNLRGKCHDCDTDYKKSASWAPRSRHQFTRLTLPAHNDASSPRERGALTQRHQHYQHASRDLHPRGPQTRRVAHRTCVTGETVAEAWPMALPLPLAGAAIICDVAIKLVAIVKRVKTIIFMRTSYWRPHVFNDRVMAHTLRLPRPLRT
jgi:hypothetical protein